MRAKYTVSANMAMQMDANQFDAFVKLAAGDAGQQRVDEWMARQGFAGKCRVGVIAMLGDDGVLTARAKCMIRSGGFFMHEEPYNEFPSDHFKTKLLLIAG